MNTVFEYFVNSTPESDFIDKVRQENPEMVDRFRSLIKNKGLDAAIDKYDEFDPEKVKERTRLKKIEDKRNARDSKEAQDREKYKEPIEEVWKIFENYTLQAIASQMKRNPRLKKFLRGKTYKNKFAELLKKKISNFIRLYDGDWHFELEKMELCTASKLDREYGIGSYDKIELELHLGKPKTDPIVWYKIRFDMHPYNFETQGTLPDGTQTPKGYLQWRSKKINDLASPQDRFRYYDMLRVMNEFADFMKPESLDTYNKEMNIKKFDL